MRVDASSGRSVSVFGRPDRTTTTMLSAALDRYRAIFAIRGSAAFSSSGLLGRFPKASVAIGALLLVAVTSGSYALAGAVSGTLALSIAAAGPLWSRVMDRWGQRRAFSFSLPLLVASATAFCTAVLTGAPVALWFVFAAACGVSIADVGSAVRSRWTAATADPALRHTAFSLESVADEAVFVIAPPLVTVLASLVHPAAGLITGLSIGVFGGVVLLLQKSTQPEPVGRGRGRVADAADAAADVEQTKALEPEHPSTHADARARASRPRLPLELAGIVAVFAAIGGVFGSFNVAAIATASDAGQDALSGLLLSVYSVGSVLMGVAVGAARLGGTPRSRFLVAAVVFGAVVPVLLLSSPSLALTAVLAFVAGLATSPLLITGSSLAGAIAPRDRLTEALAWPSTGLELGLTAGSALAGIAVEAGGPHAGFAVTALFAGGGAIVALAVSGARAALAGRTAPTAPSA